jgi:hypothetical protein
MQVEIFWSDLTEEAQERLAKANLGDDNIIDDIMPLTVLEVEE